MPSRTISVHDRSQPAARAAHHAKEAGAEMNLREQAMDRKAACLLQAAVCRTQAGVDPLNHDYWIDEAIKWLGRAHAPAGPVVVTIEARPSVGSLAAEQSSLRRERAVDGK